MRFKTENFAKPIAEKWSEAEDIKEHKVECKILEVSFRIDAENNIAG